jgi:rubredoxin
VTEGWTRVCPTCGTCDGDLAERISFRPTFRCLVCGYVWDGSKARLVFLTRPPDPDDEEGMDALADLLMKAARTR